MAYPTKKAVTDGENTRIVATCTEASCGGWNWESDWFNNRDSVAEQDALVEADQRIQSHWEEYHAPHNDG